MNTLQSRVLVALVLVSMIPAFAIGYQGYHCGHLAVMDLMRKHITSVVEARHDQFQQWLKERESHLHFIVSLPTVTQSLQSGESDYATDVLRAAQVDSGFEDLALFDGEWSLVAKIENSDHQDDDILSPGFVDGVSQSDGVFYDVAHSHHAGHVGVHFGVRIAKEDGETLGFLTGNLNLTDSLLPLLEERSGLWSTGKAYLVNSNMEILSIPQGDQNQEAFAESAADELLPTLAGAGKDVRTYTDFEGYQVIGTTIMLPLHDWAMVVEIDTSEAMEWVETLLFRATLMTLVCLVVVLLTSFWLARYLGRSLSIVADVAHRIRSGEVGMRLPRMRPQEAEEVRLAFNLMLDDMRDKEAALVRTSTLATVGELSSSIVHEMRNPLSSVRMNLQAITRSEETGTENAELADIALTQVERLTKMLDELLQYGRPVELHLERCSIQQISDSVREILEPLAKSKGVSIEVDEGPAGVNLLGDKELMTRAITNLVRNAIEATGEEGSVTLTAKIVERSGDSCVAISVRDTGMGLPGDRLERLFRPFFTTKSGGVGLGLANVKKIVELHGGTVSASPSPAGGALFEIILPRPA